MMRAYAGIHILVVLLCAAGSIDAAEIHEAVKAGDAAGAGLLLAGPAGAGSDREAGQAPTFDLVAYVRGLDAASARGLWPGFDPSEWPIAVFDGERTFLLRHPSPPPEFTPLPGQPGVLAVPGRHPAVAGNSTRDIGGVRTATIVHGPNSPPDNTRRAILEEVFHLFWLSRHVGFRPNEQARYGYPIEDATVMRTILAEDEALARAVEADSVRDAAAWAAAALEIRRRRHALLAGEVRAFETALEMLEGTANWFAEAAVGGEPKAAAARLRTEWPAEEIRWRFYTSGTAVCSLLQRLRPGWQATLDREVDRSVEDLLAEAVASAGVAAAELSPADLAEIEVRAVRWISDLATRRASVREELAGRPGARIVVEVASGAEPLRVRRFHPIDLLVMGGGEVVHPAFITLTVAEGTIEITNPARVRGSFQGTVTLTAGSERYPLAGPIHTVAVVGLKDAPRVTSAGGVLAVEAEGVRLSLPGAFLVTEGETLRITLPMTPAAAP